MKVKKKPVIVDADLFQWGIEDGVKYGNQFIPRDAQKYSKEMHSEEFPGYLGRYDAELEYRGFEDRNWKPYIDTLEGMMTISEGDYIITGIKGERYPIKPEIFNESYEIVSELPDHTGNYPLEWTKTLEG